MPEPKDLATGIKFENFIINYNKKFKNLIKIYVLTKSKFSSFIQGTIIEKFKFLDMAPVTKSNTLRSFEPGRTRNND